VRRQSQGFTLLEIAVALAILGIGVVTVMQIFQGSLRLQNKAAQQSRVVLLPREGGGVRARIDLPAAHAPGLATEA